MNYKKLFDLAKAKGLSAITVSKSSGKDTEASLFKGEMVNFTTNNTRIYTVRGIYNDKFGSITTEVEDPEFIINEIISSAKVIEKEEIAEIFKGSKSYKKRDYYCKDLETWSLDEKIHNLYKLEDLLKKSDPRITDVEVSFSESYSEYEIRNSYGLKLKTRSNLYVYVGSVVIKDGDEVKNGFKIFFANDPKEVNIKDFAKKVVDDGLKKLQGTTIKSKKYKCVLSPEAMASFISCYVGWANAEEVQKQSSRFVGQLNKQVANKKVTLLEKPLLKNIFTRGFDDEGVATYNKKIIDKGVLKTYLHDLETAKKDGVQTTGNGYGANKIGVGTINVTLKPGKFSEDELFAKVKNGIYIDSVTGLHSGMNHQSGNFSLQAEGYMIEDGKIGKPLKMITVAGNLYDLFNDVCAIGNNSKLFLSSTITPSVAIKKLSIASE